MSDPLGLTTEQRMRSDLFAFVEDIPRRIEATRQAIEALPPGTIVHIDCGPDMTREHLLQVVL